MKPALFVRSRHDVATRRSRGLRCRINHAFSLQVYYANPPGGFAAPGGPLCGM